MSTRKRQQQTVTVKLQTELVERLKSEAVKNHLSLSELLRRFAERELNLAEYQEKAEPIREMIRQETAHAAKQQSNRLAALLNRQTILAAAGYYASIAALAALDGAFYTSFESVEQLARKQALAYANAKSSDGAQAFLDDAQFKTAVSALRGKLRRGREPTYAELNNMDFSNFSDFDCDD